MQVIVRKYLSQKSQKICYFLVIMLGGREIRFLVRSSDVGELLNLRPQEVYDLDCGDYEIKPIEEKK